MTIKDDLMYPFGNPEKAVLPTEQELVALRNILELAKERVWMAEGQSISTEFDNQLAGTELIISKSSINLCSKLIENLDTYYEEN